MQWEWGSTNHDPGIIFCSGTNLAALASHQLLKPPGSGPIIYLVAYFYIGAVAAFPGALFLLLQTFSLGFLLSRHIATTGSAEISLLIQWQAAFK